MGRLLSSQLYGVGPAHIGVVGVSVAIVVGTGLLGCLIPARRASRVDVVAALRQE